ncbi:hypothetical protein BC936DRAFT_148850 [Jimgerdemannia flammicorona]|uniref:Uncharacterized protein n=1 Tax=Jimgerdemannia flammicorona TaxID=994334 RepID=A0A433DKG6_9FUNG|nr:hypothetical protein BC936DRAFT_148850 [Jimgerdemannia flammicorona]
MQATSTASLGSPLAVSRDSSSSSLSGAAASSCEIPALGALVFVSSELVIKIEPEDLEEVDQHFRDAAKGFENFEWPEVTEEKKNHSAKKKPKKKRTPKGKRGKEGEDEAVEDEVGYNSSTSLLLFFSHCVYQFIVRFVAWCINTNSSPLVLPTPPFPTLYTKMRNYGKKLISDDDESLFSKDITETGEKHKDHKENAMAHEDLRENDTGAEKGMKRYTYAKQRNTFDVDMDMVTYIEAELKRQCGQSIEPKEEEEVDEEPRFEDNYNELYEVPELNVCVDLETMFPMVVIQMYRREGNINVVLRTLCIVQIEAKPVAKGNVQWSTQMLSVIPEADLEIE